MPYGLNQEILQRITEVFAGYAQVEQAVLYGSRAMGNYKDGSDIDITLKGRDLNLRILNRICNELDDLLLPYAFDVSIFHQISNPDLRDHIARVGINLFER